MALQEQLAQLKSYSEAGRTLWVRSQQVDRLRRRVHNAIEAYGNCCCLSMLS